MFAEQLSGIYAQLSPLEQRIIENQREHIGNYRVHILDKWFNISRLTVPATIGSFCVSSRQSQQRWIIRDHAHDIGAGWCTPADIARDYLSVKVPNYKPRITTRQYQEVIAKKRSAPYYCRPTEKPFEGVYVDIKAAYWTILQIVGWHQEYMPGEYIGIRTRVADFPYHYIKMARNSLVSVGLSGMIQMYDGKGNFSFVKKPNRFTNLSLWALVCDILNGVARDCVDAGAVYCLTDGFIVESVFAQNVINCIQSWGLTPEIRHAGICEVKAPGSYRVGGYESKPFKWTKLKASDHINAPHHNWLRRKVREWSYRAFEPD